MKITDDELLSIIDDATLALGQILLRHRELSENVLDTQQTERGKERIESLKKRIDDEREELSRIRQVQRRKKELERIRKDHEKEPRTEGTSRSHLVSIRDQRGRLIGWIQSIGKNRFNFLDGKTRVVGRFVNGQTYDQRGQFVGDGNQGLRVLGQTLNKVGS